MAQAVLVSDDSRRVQLIRGARRVVIKLGTAVLTHDSGSLALGRFYTFVESIAQLHRAGYEVLLVSSGAVGLGAASLGLGGPQPLVARQACAAVGQGRLIGLYADAFERLEVTTAQVLLTEDDFANRLRYLNLRSAIAKLLGLGVIPIINENDIVSTVELAPDLGSVRKVNFGDNDRLSALVAAKIEADLLLLLTDVDGLCTQDPRTGAEGTLIPIVGEIGPAIERLAGGARAGRGGMRTKIAAARIATRSGCGVVIANGKTPGIIERLLAGEQLGTAFLPQQGLSGKRKWIAFATSVQAAVVVNEGARRALVEQKASLLPVGVTQIRGRFARGDVVSIVDERNGEFARGIANYSSDEASHISGMRSDRVEDILGVDDELVTRENIALMEEPEHAGSD